MADDFNPYHVWFGIPPEEQPANHYRLLSINLFETSADVIDNAADRQMAHLRTIQVGKHGELSQRLLNEVAAARICLLDSKKRAAYDQQLRAKLAATTASTQASSATPQIAGGSAIQRQPPRRPSDAAPAMSIPTAAALPQPADRWDDLLGKPDLKPLTGAGGKSAKSAAAKRGAKNRNIAIGIAAGVVLIAAVVFYSLNSTSAGMLVFDWSASDRSDTTVSVDGVPLTIPANGPWEYRYPAGSHRIVAEHLAYKLDAHVDVVAGERQTVPADWKPKAVLVLNWPLGLRSGAELRIDGRPQTISQHEPLEVPVEPGRRAILITRRGYDPIRTTATVAADGRKLVAITAPPTAAKLVFDWPAGDRRDAELIVDGSSRTIADGSDSEPFALTLEPGRHVVHITRRGFEPFNQSVDLSAGADSAIKPTWTPETKIATVPAVVDTPAPVEVAPQPAKKLPVPAAADQEKIAKQLNDLYKTSQPGPKDPAKAQELYDVAAKDGSSPAERYMLLMKGAEIAATAGDLSLSLQGIDTLDADYAIDALDLKQKLLEKFIAAGRPDQVAIAIPAAEQLVDQAVAADRFDIAVVLATTASKAVAKSKIATHKEDEERLARRRHDIHLLEPIYAAAKKAQETLEKAPADPEANLTVGRWLCFYKGDWTTGLPMLTKGSDEKLKALAEQEFKSPTDADQQVQIADAWWDLAQKEAGIARDSLHLHAGGIYQDATPNLASALKKAAIEKRLAEIADLKPLPATVGTVRSIAAVKFPLNQWVDVLRLVDTTSNAVKGKWSRAGKEIAVVESVDAARIVIPVAVEGSYDLEVEFNRHEGGPADLSTTIPVGGYACNVVVGNGRDGGLDVLDGERANSGRNPAKVHSDEFVNGREYRLLVKVRLQSADKASIDALLDGKPYVHWQGNPSALALHSDWTMPTLDHLGLGAWRSLATFSSARLRMISGHASVDDSVAESAPPQLAPAGAAKFSLGKWVDILRLADTTRDAVKGNWSRAGKDLNCEAGELCRIALPVAMKGSYDLEVEFTRTSGEGDVGAMFPVGQATGMAILSSYAGAASGLENVDGHDASFPGNPTSLRPGRIENGDRYRMLVSARILSNNLASIDVSLDGKPYLPHWEGDPSALSLSPNWSMPNPRQFGLAAYHSDATFHSARLRIVSGNAPTDSAVTGSAAPQLAPATATTGKSIAAAKVPFSKGIDLLAKVDANRDSIEGQWERHGSTIVCNGSTSAGDRRFLVFPTEIAEAHYELRVEFSRDSGDNCFAVSFPVGDRGAEFILADDQSKFSGLEVIDGHRLDNSDNPTARSPSTLENGRRYVVRIVVNVERDTAKVNCFLDGDELVAWKGKVDSLDQYGPWKIASHRAAVGEWNSPSTIYGATVRALK